MRFTTHQSIRATIWLCFLSLYAGCAIETEETPIEFDPSRFLDPGPEPLPCWDPEPATETTGEADAAPALILKGASPNPIDTRTRLSFTVPEGGARVVLAIYGIDGRRVRLLVDDVLGEGEYSAFWYAQDDASRPVPSGVYLISLRRRGEVKLHKVLLVR